MKEPKTKRLNGARLQIAVGIIGSDDDIYDAVAKHALANLKPKDENQALRKNTLLSMFKAFPKVLEKVNAYMWWNKNGL